MAAEANLIKKADLVRVREIDFVNRFGYSVRKLMEALGVTRRIAKQAGTTLKTYKATGTLQDGNVAEGDTIPLSKYTTQAVTYKEITLKKWRKATSAEAIIERGFDQAVTMTTDKMLQDIQKGIRKDFFDFLATGTKAVTGTTFQDALAQSWGNLQVLFEDDTVSTVYFMSIIVVFLHFGQKTGRFLATVSGRIFVRVLLLQIGQYTQPSFTMCSPFVFLHSML